MNGDDKEEAQRPRPLSGGIWTLFSWLRRSERSSSSESLSSVGSARTAVSFDFLTPGHCNYTKTPVVLTTQLGPPTETYKKRLQDRNLRRQRDRDITLHRKYGLFREYGNGYDGFSLPATKRVLTNSVDRQNRDRRATSECLQRRAAYVPGKRRAPLPPGLITSASLPRSYKRKRPAPKPPVIQETSEEIQTNHSTRMSSNFKSDGIFPPELELLMHSKTEKHDKKETGPKDVKPKAEKSFLKHIFENKKRNSAIETSTVRLLPSISELDKQAAEIVEKNKLHQSRECDSFGSAQSSKASYEGNSWFCTSCLRKYNSSVTSCSNCYLNKKCVNSSAAKCNADSSLKTSIETQTQNVESTDFCKNNTDERKILKEILKEMKDSLPKKSREHNSKINNLETETPTLRIGSSVVEKYKVPTSQPFSSSEVRRCNLTTDNTEMPSSNRILTERQRSLNETNNKNTDYNLINVVQHKVTLGFESHVNKSNIKSSSPKLLERNQVKTLLTSENQTKEIDKNGVVSKVSAESPKTDKVNLDENKSKTSNTQINKSATKESENASFPILQMKSQQNSSNINIERIPSQLMVDRNQNIDSKNPDKAKNDNIFTQIQKDTRKNYNQVVVNKSNSTAVFPEAIKIQPMSSQANVSNCNIVVSNVTVVTSNSKILDASEASIMNKVKNKSANSSTSKISMESDIKNAQLKETQTCKTTEKSQDINYPNSYKMKSFEQPSDNKPVSNLHTPLKISTLLNPLYTPRLSAINENQGMKTDLKGQNVIQTSVLSNKNNNVQKAENNEIASQPTSTTSDLTKVRDDLTATTQRTVAERTQTINEIEMSKSNLDPKVLPSTSSTPWDGSASNKFEYDRRTHLINQLEQSIARGDEVAAAEAAVQLAKLKLSCSVLSFSSQIIGESSIQRGRASEEDMQNLVTKIPHSEKKLDQNIPQSETASLENNNLSNIQSMEVHTNLEKNKVAKSNVNKDNKKDDGLNNKPSSSNQALMADIAPIDVWIEDKQAVRGPIRLRISRRATMADLRRQAEHSLGLATHLQRWIVGKSLCNDDSTMIVSLAGPDLRAPFYLCVVQSETSDKEIVENVKAVSNEKSDDNRNLSNEFYTELVELEQQSLIKNLEPFECSVCMEECGAGAGVVLRECIHTFCRECLSDVVQHCQEPTVSCPATGCSGLLQEREIRSIVSPEEYERWLARSLATAECGTRNTFHCRTPDCTGWAFCDPGVRRFPCPVCKHTNCVQCQAIHEGETCEQHQVKLREAVTAAETYKDDEGTQALLNSLISRGEALECPECKAIITKKWGCDWVKCSACKTEICWVTKGRRWGPAGRGDTSGGCRCGVDGQRCHPSCGYCH